MRPRTDLEEALVRLGRELRDAARSAVGGFGAASPSAEGVTDVQYGVDVATEIGLESRIQRCLRPWLPLRVLSEGLPAAGVVVGDGPPARRLVIDPIDGTRGLMHDKRSAWVLLGMANEHDPRLQTLESAVMVEIPTRLGGAGEILVATRGLGWSGENDAMPGVTGIGIEFRHSPRAGADLAHGFASVARFFPGMSTQLDTFTQEFFRRVEALGLAPWGEVFEDQYVSNGGQMAALVMGRDRLVIDFRAILGDPGRPLRSGHPYDLLGILVAEEAGCAICDRYGRPLDAPLDLMTRVPWVGYSSGPMRDRFAPVVAEVLTDLIGG